METVYVQFSDATETTVIAAFSCPQDTKQFPNQGSIDATDSRYQAFIDPLATLDGARSAKIAALNTACSAAITSGFVSSALGSSCTYPSASTDQANQHTVAQSSTGGALWCESSGVWALKQHTQAQAQAVVSSFATWLNKCQQQLVTLSADVDAATSVSAVQAVVWTNPT